MIQESTNRAATATGRETIRVHGLRKKYDALEILRGIDFSACEHETISIIGRSGSGKSTLLRCLNLLEVPEVSQFLLKGEEILFRKDANGSAPQDRGQVERLRRSMAMVFQQFNLWSHWTALQNVSKVPQHVHGVPAAEAKDRALHYLEKVGMADKRDAYPSQLSGGQQQRVAIARALAVDPDILLFDEPTSALDPELVGEVLLVMRALAEEGRTMIVVTHEMAFAREVSNRVVFLHEGRVEEEGHPSEVLTSPRSQRLNEFLGRASGSGRRPS
jgi:octopine/nopaline transport system ATP-binding protein